jgi:hypothetical protein
MKRPTCSLRNQLALFLEPQARHQLDAETREALIAALADLLLEAHGVAEEADLGDQEACDEH